MHMSVIPSMEMRLLVVKHIYLGFQVICFSAKNIKASGKVTKENCIRDRVYISVFTEA